MKFNSVVDGLLKMSFSVPTEKRSAIIFGI